MALVEGDGHDEDILPEDLPLPGRVGVAMVSVAETGLCLLANARHVGVAGAEDDVDVEAKRQVRLGMARPVGRLSP